jgi:DMSO reductase anchor subunit
MHPAFSVIFLTTLIGVGQGLFLALFTGQLYSAIKFLPVQDATLFYGYGSLIAVGFLAAGLVASFFHLGHPERAWRSAAKWKTSWLSREVLVLPAFMGMTFIYAMIHINNWNPTLFNLTENIIVDLSLLVGALNVVLAFSLFICTAMIYACIKFLQEWATPLTVVNYTLLGMASGFAICTAYAAYINSNLVTFYAGWTILLTVTALISRSAALIRNRNIKYKSDLSSAIGIRHPKIKQISQGAMGGSFNTREYFHGAKPLFFKSIKWVFLVLVFILPILLIIAGLAKHSFIFFVVAFAVQYIGLLAERWFFFAQANHPQNLYYQTI